MKRLVITSFALTAVLLSACASPAAPQSADRSATGSSSATTDSPSQATSSQSQTASSSPTPTPSRSVRGNLIKVVGQPAFFTGQDRKTLAATWVMTALEPIQCTGPYAQAAKNGHFIAATVDLETFPALENDLVMMQAVNWKFIQPNGTTFNGEVSGNGYMCITDTERFPGKVGPGEKVSGKIVFDLPAETGVLVFSQSGVTGWEWAIPAK